MSKHKSHIEDKECLCSKCPLRFVCFTEERIFSDPILQGLFEALMAKGYSKEKSLDLVTNEIKARISYPNNEPLPNTPIMSTPWVIYTTPDSVTKYPYTITSNTWDGTSNNVTNTNSSNWTVTYAMANGKEMSWNVDCNGNYKSR